MNQKIKIKNYTTQVSVTKTLSEIEELLLKFKASDILKQYDEDQNITALRFILRIEGKPIPFKLYFDWQKVAEVLSRQYQRDYYIRDVRNDKKRALQVGWRIMKDWLYSNLSIIEIGIAKVQQLLLSYATMNNDMTFFECFEKHQFDNLLIETSKEVDKSE